MVNATGVERNILTLVHALLFPYSVLKCTAAIYLPDFDENIARLSLSFYSGMSTLMKLLKKHQILYLLVQLKRAKAQASQQILAVTHVMSLSIK